jgi:hypothetical protein
MVQSSNKAMEDRSEIDDIERASFLEESKVKRPAVLKSYKGRRTLFSSILGCTIVSGLLATLLLGLNIGEHGHLLFLGLESSDTME